MSRAVLLSLGVALCVMGCVQKPSAPGASSFPTAAPAQLNPIVLDRQDASAAARIEVVNLRMQPTGRRDYSLRYKLAMTFPDGKQFALDFTYGGFTLVSGREDGRTTFQVYIERIEGAASAPPTAEVLPVSLREPAILAIETVHNADNSIYVIEFPFLVELARTSQQIRNEDDKALRALALSQLMQNYSLLLPVQKSRLRTGDNIWPSSASEWRQLWENELIPAMIRSRTMKELFDLTPPNARGNFTSIDDLVPVLAKTIQQVYDSTTISVLVKGTGVWEGQDVLYASGPMRIQGDIGNNQSPMQLAISGTEDILIDPYSGQSVRREWAMGGNGSIKSGPGAGAQVGVLLQVSVTTSPAANARRAYVPPEIPAASGPSVSGARGFGDLPRAGTAKRISDIYRDPIDAIFTIAAGSSQGSGFAVSPTQILTNRHVVDGAPPGSIRLMRNGAVVANAQIERQFDGDLDLVVLRTDRPLSARSLVLAEELPEIGTEVIVIGAPIGLEGSITGGMVSQLRLGRDAGYLQIDVSINPGNSGGPVFDRLGRVVGIASARLVQQNRVLGIGLALGAETIRKAISGTVPLSSAP